MGRNYIQMARGRAENLQTFKRQTYHPTLVAFINAGKKYLNNVLAACKKICIDRYFLICVIVNVSSVSFQSTGFVKLSWVYGRSFTNRSNAKDMEERQS